MNLLLVIDIDGTIAHAGDRFAKAGPEPKRDDREVYTAWVNRVQTAESLAADKPVAGMATLLLDWAFSQHIEPVYLTSREEKWRTVTEKWLKDNNFPNYRLVMRQDNDWSDTAKYKEAYISWVLKYTQLETAVVIDDDEHGTIEAMCARNGWTFLKARSGGQK